MVVQVFMAYRQAARQVLVLASGNESKFYRTLPLPGIYSATFNHRPRHKGELFLPLTLTSKLST